MLTTKVLLLKIVVAMVTKTYKKHMRCLFATGSFIELVNCILRLNFALVGQMFPFICQKCRKKKGKYGRLLWKQSLLFSHKYAIFYHITVSTKQ